MVGAFQDFRSALVQVLGPRSFAVVGLAMETQRLGLEANASERKPVAAPTYMAMIESHKSQRLLLSMLAKST